MTISPVEKLSVEFGKYIELEQKHKEVETSIAKRVVLAISALIVIPFVIAGYLYSGLQGSAIFFIISLFLLLIGFGLHHHKTAILNVEKREDRRNKILNALSFIVGNKVQEALNIKKNMDEEKDIIMKSLKSEEYKKFFDDLYLFVENKDLNDDMEMLRKVEKIATLYDRKFYSVLFHELKMNICTWNEILIKREKVL